MASGGFNNQGNSKGRAPLSNSGAQWKYNPSRKDAGDHWNQTRHNIPNNLSLQDWQPKKDHQKTSKNERQSNTGKNTDVTIIPESAAETLETSRSHGADGTSSLGRSSLPSFPRSKFTTSLSPHFGKNGARQKISDDRTSSCGDADRSIGQNMHRWEEPKLHQTNPRNETRNAEDESDLLREKFAKMPNTNQVMGRLMQIRDYMAQVTGVLDVLQRSDDKRNNHDQILKFSKLLNHLHTQEHEYDLILQQMAIQQDDGLAVSVNDSDDSSTECDEEGDVEDSSGVQQLNALTTEPTSSDRESADQIAESDQFSRRNELMKKMLESQQKLKALQDQQAALLVLQHKAENRLAEARAFRNQLVDTNDNTKESQSPVEYQNYASHEMQDDLENLQERLNLLRDLYQAESMSRGGDDETKGGEEADAVVELQRQELQNKLQDLREKKRLMDNLLQQLNVLPEGLTEASTNDDGSPPGISSTVRAQQTLQSAQEVLQTLDTDEPFRKLQAMRSRLDQLHGLVAISCQQPALTSESRSAMPTATQLGSARQTNSSQTEGNEAQIRSSKGKDANKIKKTRNNKKDNISREHSNEYLARNLHEMRTTANEERLAAEHDCWEDESRVWENMTKLQSTKEKLSKLEDLLARLHDTQASGVSLNEELGRQVLETLDDDFASCSQVLQPPPSLLGGDQETFSLTPGHGRSDRSNKVGSATESARLYDEDFEFDRVLMQLKQQYSANSGACDDVSRVRPQSARQASTLPLRGSRQKPRTYSDASSKSNQDSRSRVQDRHTSLKNTVGQQILPIHKPICEGDDQFPFSNQELWSEMRQQLIMKEELRQKKRELEELMKKDQGKSNSRNRDNMSDNVSYSNKSEVLGSYGGTEGMTAATWGGSTQGNPDEDQDEQNESQEDNDDADNNGAYSSEGVGPSILESTSPSHRNETHSSTNVELIRKMQSCLNSEIGEHPFSNNVTSTVPKSRSELKDMRNIWEKPVQIQGSSTTWSSHLPRQPLRQNVSCSEEHVPERVTDSSLGNVADVSPTTWQQQALQFQQQFEQNNSLRQSIIRDQQNLTSLMQQSNNLSISAGSTPSDGFRPFFPDVLQQYSHQLQQQQLLLNLNQCYHLQHLQQLEIQQLQHQLQQLLQVHQTSSVLGNEESPQQCGLGIAGTLPDEVDMRCIPTAPWFASNPLASSSFTHCSPTITAGQSTIGSSHFPPSLSTQHNLSRGSETLNNQVAPGIRANNYWDNFRSYSRQNLLSATSGNKSTRSSANTVTNHPEAHPSALLQSRQFLQQDIMSSGSTLRPANVTHVSVATATESASRVEERPSSTRQLGSLFTIPKLDLDSIGTKPKPRKEKLNEDYRTDIKPCVHDQLPAIGPTTLSGVDGGYKPGLSSGISGTAYLTNTSCSSSALSLSSSVRESGYTCDVPCQSFPSRTGDVDDLNQHTLFDTLRESIYAEVASLISQNESRPHFLIQMFQELQKLNSDYMRQNALVSVHTLASQAESETELLNSAARRRRHGTTVWVEPAANNTSEQTASESFMTSDEEELRVKEQTRQKPPVQQGTDPETSPSRSTSLPCQSTSEGASSSAVEQSSEVSTSDIPYSGLNTSQLDDQIQAIMMEIIPFLKTHLEDTCSPKFLTYLRQLTLTMVTQRDEAMELTQFFRKQLASILQDTLMKYSGRRLRDCGEDLLVDMSEVLFNELAFLRLVQNMENGNVRARSARGSFQSMMENAVSSSVENSPKKERSSANDIDAAMSLPATETTKVEVEDFSHVKMEHDDIRQVHDDTTAANCDLPDGEDGLNCTKPSNSSYFVHEVQADNLNLNLSSAAAGGRRHERHQDQEEVFTGEPDIETEGDGLEDNQDLAEADQSQSHPGSERTVCAVAINTADSTFTLNSHSGDDLIRPETMEDDHGRRQATGAYGFLEAANEVVANEEREQGLDEVPIKLQALTQDEINSRRLDEEAQNSLVEEILSDSVEAELAEIVIPVREPSNCTEPQ